MKFKEELEYNLGVSKEKGLNEDIDIDYAIDRLSDENNSELISELQSNKKIDGTDRVDMSYLINRLENEEHPQYEVRG